MNLLQSLIDEDRKKRAANAACDGTMSVWTASIAGNPRMAMIFQQVPELEQNQTETVQNWISDNQIQNGITPIGSMR